MNNTPDLKPLQTLPDGHHWTGPLELRDLLGEMFSYDPDDRPDADSVLDRLEKISVIDTGIFPTIFPFCKELKYLNIFHCHILVFVVYLLRLYH